MTLTNSLPFPSSLTQRPAGFLAPGDNGGPSFATLSIITHQLPFERSPSSRVPSLGHSQAFRNSVSALPIIFLHTTRANRRCVRHNDFPRKN